MTIEERLERLERELNQARRHTVWLILGLAGLTFLGVFVWSANRGVAREVRARAFIVEDENGRKRGGLAVAENNSIGLVLSDETGQPRVTLATNGSLTSLVFSEKRNPLRLVLGTLGENSGLGLSLSDGNGRSRARLSVSRDGPWLMLHDANGKTRFSVTVGQEGMTGLNMDDENGKHRLLMGNIPALGPIMALSDENDHAFWATPLAHR